MASSHLSVCFFTVPKFGNQVIVPLKGSQHLPTQFADARNMDSVWFKESFGMQATEAELVPELASASHRLQRISLHALLWVSNCSHLVGLVFANHTSIIHYFQTVSLAAVYTRLIGLCTFQTVNQSNKLKYKVTYLGGWPSFAYVQL